MKKILRCLEDELTKNQDLMLVTIESASGSTPRKAGASMVVNEGGILGGTIGGGLLEYECTLKAQTLLALRENGSETFILDNTKAGALGMVCGGRTEVLFTLITVEMLPEIDSIVSHIQVQVGGNPFAKKERIFLVGGGHVALEVSRLLDYLDFDYILIEEREEFAGEERFPNAVERIVCPLEEMKEACERLSLLPIGERDGFCILTRGHAGDTKAIRFALSTKASYIGAMGSQRKKHTVFAQLKSEGFAEVEERVVTPIGMDIGGQTPEELAISIVGQLIQWRGSNKEV